VAVDQAMPGDGSAKIADEDDGKAKIIEVEEEPEKKEAAKAEKSVAPASTSASVNHDLATSTKIDFLKDIESHIEVIYECLDDDLDENMVISSSASGSMLNTSNEVISVSDSGPSQSDQHESEKSVGDLEVTAAVAAKEKEPSVVKVTEVIKD